MAGQNPQCSLNRTGAQPRFTDPGSKPQQQEHTAAPQRCLLPRTASPPRAHRDLFPNSHPRRSDAASHRSAAASLQGAASL